MTDQPSRSTSSRVAQARASQQSASSSGSEGTQQSRWAPSSSFTSSSTSSSSSSTSSWRTRPNEATISTSSTWNKSHSSTVRPSPGSSASRWATSTPSRTDDPVSSITSSLQTTSLYDTHPSGPSPAQSSPRNDGLTVRNTLRPLGGKSLDRLSLLASPSRGLDSSSNISSELSLQGDMDLTSPKVQIEFREYISGRIRKVLPLLTPAALTVLDGAKYLSSQPQKGGVGEGEEELQQILLLVRKLREAIVASKRIDAFAVEVYELSSILAVLCEDAMQLVASLSRLVLELYPQVPTQIEERVGKEDVGLLCAQLGLKHTAEEGEEARLRMATLYLLQSLCLSGRALRLGQYATSSDGSAVETLHRDLREYRSLRSTTVSIYGDKDWKRHVGFCDAVYCALRNIDPFRFTTLLEGKGGYEVDSWQRLILLQAVPMLRNAAWGVARRTYIYLPIPSSVVVLIKEDKKVDEGEERKPEQEWLGQLLLLSTDFLSPTKAELDQIKEEESVKVREETPDDWDTPSADSLIRTPAQAIQDKRLHTFLLTQFPSDLSARFMPIKDGTTALKIK